MRTFLCCLPAVVVSLSVAPGAIPQQPTFSVKVDLVRVDVSVTRGTVPVGGLTAADFELSDNGVRQTIQPLAVEEVPLEAWLVLDTSSSVRENLPQLIGAASAFVDGLSPRDRVALVGFSETVRVWQRPTPDLGAMHRTLMLLKTSGLTALYDATYAALRLRQPGGTRGVTVIFTDGCDDISWLTADKVAESAERSDQTIYGVTLGDNGRESAGDSRGTPQYRFLRRLAESSGGQVFDPTWSKLKDAFAGILRDIRARYVLSYYPTSVTPGWHTVEVRLTRTRGVVRGRRGYWVEAKK